MGAYCLQLKVRLYMIKQKQDLNSFMRVSTVVILLVLSILISGPSSVLAQDDEQQADDYTSYLLAVLDATSITPIENLEGFLVSVADPRAGFASEYKVDFQLRQSTYDLIKNGGIKLAFPAGFGLEAIESIDLSDNCQAFKLGVDRWVVTDQLLTVFLQAIRCDDCEEYLALDTGDPDTTLIEISLNITSIINRPEAGDYQIAGVAFKQNGSVIAGPTFSETFTIVANEVSSIVVSPSEDITVSAGQTVNFSAQAFDEMGNRIDGLSFLWNLDCGECIGYFVNSTLHVTTPGEARAIASANGVSGESGLIVAGPGDLARMELAASPTGFVGYALLPEANLTLYDAYGNLKTDYSLSSKPISVLTSAGEFFPNSLADDALLVDGAIDLAAAGIEYQGLSGTIAVYADNGTISSNAANVAFNGYDLVDVLDAQEQTISSVYAGQSTPVSVRVISNGDLRAESPATIRARFASGAEVTEVTFVPGPLGQVTTVALSLPVIQHSLDEDELIVELDAQFELNGSMYETSSKGTYTVEIIHPTAFEFVEGSFKPDTILTGLSFGAAFEVFAEGFDQPIDSTQVAIHIVSAPGGDILGTLYRGSPEYTVNQNGTIGYANLESVLDEAASLSSGWYTLRVDYALFSLGAIFTIDDMNPDSIYVMESVDLVSDPASVSPLAVAGGAPAVFNFVITSSNDFPLAIDFEQSSFTVTGAGFATSTSVNVEGGVITPGDNRFTTDQVYIPANEEGNQLSIEADLWYVVPGISESVEYHTNFAELKIVVTSLPVVQIISLDVIAPNKPNVNTLQQFQLLGRVANRSTTPLTGAELRLVSDGSSTFEPDRMTIDIEANDTVDVFWNVTAAPEPNPAEIIIMDVDHAGVTHLSPVDNVALITVQTPASLDLTYSLFGVENSLADYGSEVSLTVELVNSGMAQVSDGAYRMVVKGLDLDGPDTLNGSISADRHIEFSFTVPQRDTIVSIGFELTALPDDLNSLEPATIDDASFNVFIGVVSGAAELFVEITPLGTNLVLPGREKELFQIDLTNTGISRVSTLQLGKITMTLLNGFGYPLDALSTVNIGNTGFYESDLKVSSLTAGDSVLMFYFENFVIEPRVTRQLIFKAELKETLESSVSFDLKKSGIEARFTEGPNIGQLVLVVSDSEAENISSPILAVKEAHLSGSFIVETNPFNPGDPSESPVSFSYELEAAADVEFRIFTLIGEEVYSSKYNAGAEGGMAGENLIDWDGRNDEGHVVVNGVYIAQIENMATGDIARLKVAVVK